LKKSHFSDIITLGTKMTEIKKEIKTMSVPKMWNPGKVFPLDPSIKSSKKIRIEIA
jgi:hypothetical protein